MYNFGEMPKYSIVVPFHNEQESVTALYDRLKAVMEATGDTFELVFVDDGSLDRTYKLLREIVTVGSGIRARAGRICDRHGWRPAARS
jgi:glycosyltransferase involved in cell wall biosynthesis